MTNDELQEIGMQYRAMKREERERMSEWYDAVHPDADQLRADLAALRAENKRLREALQFYANMHNYIYKEDEPGIRSMRVLRDSGNIARAALAAALAAGA